MKKIIAVLLFAIMEIQTYADVVVVNANEPKEPNPYEAGVILGVAAG